jgi:hypothetical protein
VAYDKRHVARLLKGLDWTLQMPNHRAAQRDEQAIERWRDEVWPVLLGRARQERRVLVFEDESGFNLLPGLVRTYAPKRRTPLIRQKQTRDHLLVMGGVTPGGKVYTLVGRKALNGTHRIALLVHLRKVAGERLLVVWDGSPIQRRAAVREVAEGAKGKVALAFVPSYAPDLCRPGLPPGISLRMHFIGHFEVIDFRHDGLGGLQHAVQAAQHGEGQDHLAVLGRLVVALQQVGDGPQEAGEAGFAYVHPWWLRHGRDDPRHGIDLGHGRIRCPPGRQRLFLFAVKPREDELPSILPGPLPWLVELIRAEASGDSSDSPCDAACILTGTLSGSRGTHPSIDGPG